MHIRWPTLFAMASLAVVACSKGPDVQGEWFFDYAQTKLSEFPNTYYESARLLIADVEPKYGQITVTDTTVVLGGAVCTIMRINDADGLRCNERGKTSNLGVYYEDGHLLIRTNTDPSLSLVFGRNRQDPYQVYGIDPTAKHLEENTEDASKSISPEENNHADTLKGLARTANFDAFYEKNSIKRDGRFSSVTMVLNYLSPQNSVSEKAPALSSVQFLTFDCPASNYRLDRFLMHQEANGQGAVISDSGSSAVPEDWKPVPENSVNKLMYLQACQK